MALNIYDGHVVYYEGKWTKTDIGEVIVKSDTAGEGKHKPFSNMVAKTEEQLNYLLSLEIQKEENTRKPIYIERQQSTFNVVAEIPQYSQRLESLSVLS